MAELKYKKDSIFVRAVEKWGTTAQINQCIEECAELIVVLRHEQRNDRIDLGKELYESVIEELVDVHIMLQQMIYVFGVDDFEKKYAEKITRFEKKLQESGEIV